MWTSMLLESLGQTPVAPTGLVHMGQQEHTVKDSVKARILWERPARGRKDLMCNWESLLVDRKEVL